MSENSEKVQKKPSALAIANKSNSLGALKGTQIKEVIADMLVKIDEKYKEITNSNELITVFSTVFEKNPALKQCSLPSIFGAMQQTLNLNLSPDPALNYVYYVPRKGSVQFQIGYQGYMELARRAGNIKSINARVVYEGDEFDVDYGVHKKITHKPKFLTKKIENVICAYAIAYYNNGFYDFEVLTKEDIEDRRQLSPMQKADPSGAWLNHYAEMAKAKAVRALAKYLQLSPQVKQSMSYDGSVISKSLENHDEDVQVTRDYELDESDYEAEVIDENNDGGSKNMFETMMNEGM